MAYLVLPTFNYSFISILILFWNVIGSGGDYFTRSMRDLIKTYDPALVVLIETRISGADAERQIQGIGFGKEIRPLTKGKGVGLEAFRRGVLLAQ